MKNKYSVDLIKLLIRTCMKTNSQSTTHNFKAAFLVNALCRLEKIDEQITKHITLITALKDIGLGQNTTEQERNLSNYFYFKLFSPYKNLAYIFLAKNMPYQEYLCNNDIYSYGLKLKLADKIISIIDQNNQNCTVFDIYNLQNAVKNGQFAIDDKKICLKLFENKKFMQYLFSQKSIESIENLLYLNDCNDKELVELYDLLNFSYEFKDTITLSHCSTVAYYSKSIGTLMGCSKEDCEKLFIAGLIHDIGKSQVNPTILNKTGPYGSFTDEERKQMQMHVTYTEQIIGTLFTKEIRNMAIHHHEKLDGSGYPRHLTGKDLTTLDRIIAVSDIISALYEVRPYKKANTPEQVIKILTDMSLKNQLDSNIVDFYIANQDCIDKEVLKNNFHQKQDLHEYSEEMPKIEKELTDEQIDSII